jgi:aldose sugar dehydrogenase
VWDITVAPTAIRFLNSSALGDRYLNDLFVAGYNIGYIYHFDLNDDDRTEFQLDADLSDRVADDFNEADPLVFAKISAG